MSKNAIMLFALTLGFALIPNFASSEIIVIDDFSTAFGSGFLAVTTGTPTASQGAETSGSILGNSISRNATLELDSAPNSFSRAIAAIDAGSLSWSNDSGVTSELSINHEFSAVDVTHAGTPKGAIILDIDTLDLAADIQITLVDSNDRTATFSRSASSAQQLEFAYADFLGVNSNLDLSNIKQVTTVFDSGQDVDMVVGRLVFSTPEPTSIMLFSLAGIGFASRRRRKLS